MITGGAARKYFKRDRASKSEGLPLTGNEEGQNLDDLQFLGTDDDSEDNLPWYKHPFKFVKILVPHVVLIVVLLSYTALGAYVLQQIETSVEIKVRSDKIKHIISLYTDVINRTWAMRLRDDIGKDEWNIKIKAELANISAAHEGGHYSLDVSKLESRWTFPSAVLYALTLLTTCGYDQVAPLTDGGKIFAVAFALIGIPLMFITAADIGKFLSEMTLRAWKRVKWGVVYLNRRIRQLRKSAGEGGSRRSSNSTTASQRKFEEAMGLEPGTLENDIDGVDQEGLWFPIGAYISLICLYCALGGWLYTTWEVDWGFIHAFQFSFNLITTVGLGGIVVEDGLYLVLVMVYIIIGLAVVTMCVDLASTHLKAYFTKIHYFGRARSRFLGMSEDIREMMAIITAMRRKKGGKICWDDVRAYLQLEQQMLMRPFVPRHVHLWRFIDETSSALSTMRQNSFQSDMLCSSLTSLPRPSRGASVFRNDFAVAQDNILARFPNANTQQLAVPMRTDRNQNLAPPTLTFNHTHRSSPNLNRRPSPILNRQLSPNVTRKHEKP